MITNLRLLSIEQLERYWWGAPEHVWIARSGVRVVSCVPRDDARGVKSVVAYLLYYMTGRGRSK